MAREKGTFNFSANLEVKKQGPLDARQTMITYAELTQAATWQDESGKMYLFDGLTVPVINGSEKQLYMLIDAARYNQAASWKRIDAGAAVSEEEIYILPGDILTLTEDSDDTQANAILGTAQNWKKAFDAKKVFVSNTSVGLMTLNPYLYGFSVFYSENKKPILLHVSLQDDGGGGNWMTVPVSEIIKTELVGSDSAVQSVTATANKGIEIGGTATKPTVGLKIDSVTPGNVDLAVGANGLKATLSSKAVKSGNKILRVETDKSISATVSLGYDSVTKKLQLKGIDEEVFNELDATPFIKDGMLDSATLEVNPSGQSAGTYIKLVFNTEAGKDPIYINVTSLIDVYTQGNGISISGKTISVKLDAAGNSEGYLKLTAAGLKVEGVNAAVAAAIAEAFSWHDA